MKRYGLVGEYDLFIDEVDDGEYYGADEVDDTIERQQAEIDDVRKDALILKERTRNNPELWDTDGICLLIDDIINKLKGE